MNWFKKYADTFSDELEDCNNADCLFAKLNELGLAYKEVPLPEFGIDAIVFSMGSDRYVTDKDNILIEPASKFIYQLLDRSMSVDDYYDVKFPSVWEMDFSEYSNGDPYGYHGTSEDLLPSIMRDGLTPMNRTRGIANRGTGAAVFIFMGTPEIASEHGSVLLRIDIPAMEKDGFLPEASLESPVKEKMVAELIARQLGVDGFYYEVEPGIYENTVVVFGVIPPKYIQVVENG